MKKLVLLLIIFVLTACSNEPKPEPKILKDVAEGIYYVDPVFLTDIKKYRFPVNDLGIYTTDKIVVDVNKSINNAPVLEVRSDGTKFLHVKKESDIRITYDRYSKANARESRDPIWESIEYQQDQMSK